MIKYNDLKKIQKIINYNFKNIELLKHCFTHSSLYRKNIKKNKISTASEYERLEFLGDRVLGITIAYLIYKQFPHYSEGKMSIKFSYLVQKNFLSNIASQLGLYNFIQISKDKNINIKRNKSILSDTLEAIIGAIFVDGGYSSSNKFIGSIWKQYILDENLKIYDSKTTLQELSQKLSKKLPTYSLIKKTGPAHSLVFFVNVSCLNIKNVSGKGPSKREAERDAADNFLKKFKKYTKKQNEK